MKNIAIFGAGGFGREVKMLIEQINERSPSFNIVGFYDDDRNAIGTKVNGIPVLGGVEELNKLTTPCSVVFALGNPSVKKKIIEKINNSYISYPTLIHPNVFIGKDNVTIGEGSIITAGCLITVNIQIGKHVILNLGCTVGHDTVIGDYSSFMPSINISGEVNIAEGVYAGTGAKIINQLEIGKYTIVGAGAVVTKSLPEYCTAVGAPAKPIKFHNDQ